MAVLTLRTSALAASLLAFSLWGSTAYADESLDYTYTLTPDGSAVITGYTGTDTTLVLPDTLDGAKVTEIGDNAFARNQTLTSVTVPDGVTAIGDFAFNDCSGLTQITLPDSLAAVGEGAFFSCTRLTAVELPDGLQSLGDSAFYYCKSLQSVSVPDSVTDLGIHVFSECTALTQAYIGSGPKDLPAQTFYGCTNLTSVVLPDALQSIGDRAFVNCASLQALTLPDTLQRIGDYAFQHSGLSSAALHCAEIGQGAFQNSALQSLTMSDGVQKIGQSAFSGTFVETLTLPATVTELGLPILDESSPDGIVSYVVDAKNNVYASENGLLFNKDKTELLSVPALWNENNGIFVVPDSVTKIADNAFFNCYSIQEIQLPDSVDTIGSNAFMFCSSLEKINIPAGVARLPEQAFASCSSLTDVSLSEGLQTIADNAFNQCSGLRTLALPDSVTSITAAAFSGCEQEITLSLSDDNPTYCFADGALYTKDKRTLTAYLGAGAAFTVPDGVTEIGLRAIVCPATKSVTLPVGITKLGEHALGFSSNAGSLTQTADFTVYISPAETEGPVMAYAAKNEIACFTGEPKPNAASFALKAGESAQFSLENTPAQLVQYASSDNRIAAVSEDGRITAAANGTATIYAVVGQRYFSAAVTVSGGSAPEDPYAGYLTFPDEESINTWLPQYQKYNHTFSLTAEDNANIVNYSSRNYAYILACQNADSHYKEIAIADYGKDGYNQFKTVGQNLHWEAGRYTLSDNVIAYSGTDDVSNLTGTGSTLRDLLASVGRVVTTKTFTSTSLLHSVADNFAQGAHPIVLEFYLPKDCTGAAYIAPISEYSNEYELFLNDGIQLKVIGAGVRTCAETNLPEWYLQLTVVQTPEPTPSPTPSPEPTVVPTATPTAAPTQTPAPTIAPTAVPTPAPTAAPTAEPTAVPTAAPTATPDDSKFFTCSRCGYHNWTAVAGGYRCDHCGAVVTQQLSGYPNVKGYTDTAALAKANKLVQSPAAAATAPAAAKATPTPAPTEVPTPAPTAAPTAEPTATAEPAATATPAPDSEPEKASLPIVPLVLLVILVVVGLGAVLVVRVILPRRNSEHYHRDR